jgi:hypothetical protein
MIALGVYRILVFGLLIGTVVAFLLVPMCGRALRRFTVASRVPMASLLRRMTGWPAQEAINTPATATVLATLFWSVLGVLISGVLILLGAPLLCLLIGFLAGLLTGALCSLMKEPQPRRAQVLADIFPEDSNPPGWHL